MATPEFQLLFDRQKAHFHQVVKHTSMADRKNKLRHFREVFLARRADIYAAAYTDLGRNEMETEVADILPTILEISHTLKNLEDWAKPQYKAGGWLMTGTKAYVYPEPKGVCQIISPWNFPFLLALGPLTSAIAAGNTVILKPSEFTPNCSKLLAEMITAAFPEEEVAVLLGDYTVAESLSTLPFDHVFFTGSPEIGRKVMRAAAEHLSSITLELGGVNPAIVDKSANLRDTAEKIVWGKLYNCGQACVSVNDIWVHASVKDALLDEIKSAMERLYGDVSQIEKNNDFARIVHPKHITRINRILESTVAAGGKVIMGGAGNEETRFFPPTIIEGAGLDSAAFQEEIFGPMVAITTWTDEQQLFNDINSRPKPLSLYCFTRSDAFFERVLKNTSAGTTCLNEVILQFAHPELPFGGTNWSGFGKAHGQAGFLAFSNERSVLRQRTGITNGKLFYPPYAESFHQLLKTLEKWL